MLIAIANLIYIQLCHRSNYALPHEVGGECKWFGGECKWFGGVHLRDYTAELLSSPLVWQGVEGSANTHCNSWLAAYWFQKFIFENESFRFSKSHKKVRQSMASHWCK